MKDVVGYEGLYTVSIDGVVTKKGGKVVKPFDHKGYLRVNLRKDGEVKKFRVHRLVAEAYIPNPDVLPQVDHIDENKSNNHASNLRWCANKDNSTWFSKNNPQVVNSGRAPKEIKVNGMVYPSCGRAAKAIAEVTGKNQATISKELRRVLNGQRTPGVMYERFSVELP